MMEQATKKRPRDRRKKSARRVDTRRGTFLRYRAREIWDTPVTYGDHEYTEVHVVAYTYEFTLTLRSSVPGVPPVGLFGFWNAYDDVARAIPESQVKLRVERLLKRAQEGSLSCLERQCFSACLY